MRQRTAWGLTLSVVFAVIASPAQAQEAPPETPTEQTEQPAPTPNKGKPEYADDVQKKVTKIIAEPPFKKSETVTSFRFKEQGEKKKSSNEIPAWAEFLVDVVAVIALLFASLGEIIVWLIFVAIIALLFIYREQWLKLLGFIRGRKATITPLPQTNVPLPFDKLPDDIAGTALKFWREGEKAAALSILYRGTLVGLNRGYRIALPKGATELEVLREVSLQHPSLRDYIATLTSAWQRLAYAHRPPEQITDLIDGYRRHFETPRP
jgi:hypothetical protein